MYSQPGCEVPESPTLVLVSVNNESGSTSLKWIPHSSTSIAGYIIYTYNNGDAMPVDTLWDPTATSFLVNSTAAKYSSVSYVVASYRLPALPGMTGCPSPLSNALSTIFPSTTIDTCSKKILITWNKYSSSPKKVISYTVLSSVNGNSMIETGTTNSDSNTFSFNNFTINAEYRFVIKANLEDGSTSFSSVTPSLSTRMQRPPEWINADYSTVKADGKIYLSFSIDPMSEINRYDLERKIGTNGTFQKIAQLKPINNSITYTDSQADNKTINQYRLSAVNNCNNSAAVSNICSNIVIVAKNENNDLKLSWNRYEDWIGKISSYRLFTNTGNGYEEIELLQADDTSCTIPYDKIMYHVNSDKICFYIEAAESFNPYGVNGLSSSSVACIEPVEIVTVPNTFTPNNDLINDFFKPVLSFTPKNYSFKITDIHGKIIFETNDFIESWNGTYKGNQCQQGIYLWFLKTQTPSGKNIVKTGSVTIINNK